MTGGILSRRRIGRRRGSTLWFGLCLGALLPSAAVLAQDPAAAPRPPAGTRNDGVVTPPAQIDPGMARAAPHLPPRSTPVLHPRARNSHGVRIVPK